MGPATTLLGTKAGSNIDKFDFVVRTNEAAFQDSSMFTDYGCNTDIVYVNNAFLKRTIRGVDKDPPKEKRIKNLINLLIKFEQRNVKYLVVKQERTEKLINSAIKAYNKVKEQNINLEVLTSSRQFMNPRWKSLWNKSKKSMYEPTLACFMISDLVLLNPKLIYITGMDFYSGTTHWAGTYNQDISQKKEELIRRKNHHLIADIQYIKELREACKFLKCDSMMSYFLD